MDEHEEIAARLESVRLANALLRRLAASEEPDPSLLAEFGIDVDELRAQVGDDPIAAAVEICRRGGCDRETLAAIEATLRIQQDDPDAWQF